MRDTNEGVANSAMKSAFLFCKFRTSCLQVHFVHILRASCFGELNAKKETGCLPMEVKVSKSMFSLSHDSFINRAQCRR